MVNIGGARTSSKIYRFFRASNGYIHRHERNRDVFNNKKIIYDTTKSYYWRSTEGRNIIECHFSVTTGDFEYAEYVHSNVKPAPTAPRVRIKKPLSKIGNNYYRLSYSANEY